MTLPKPMPWRKAQLETTPARSLCDTTLQHSHCSTSGYLTLTLALTRTPKPSHNV